jgi:hypothetical protein
MARGAFLRTIAAVLIRDLVSYGLASIVAATVVVACIFSFEASPGVAAIGGIAVALFYGSIITFVFALPASAFFIAIGEWKELGRAYHVVAGLFSAILSYGAIVMSRQPDQDLAMLAFVAFGGAVGGGVFFAARIVLVSLLGGLGRVPLAADRDYP